MVSDKLMITPKIWELMIVLLNIVYIEWLLS